MTYRNAPGLLWVQEATYILVVNLASGAARQLAGPEAALWDWLNSGRTGAEAARLLALAFDLAAPDAQRTLENTLAQWRAVGIVEDADAEPAHG